MKTLGPLPLKDIRINDPLFGHYIEKLHTEIIPYQWDMLNDRLKSGARSGCLKNFRIAAGLEQGEYYGMVFQDSDLAKWLEAVSYSLATRPDPELEARADACIELIKKVQQPDGYLNTYYTLKEPGKRWTNLKEGHELYCAGHFIEAAVAYFEATGKRDFLEVMCRYADLIDRTFGPEPGKLKGYPGHEEIELALVKLYRATGEQRYLRLSDYFVSQRGSRPLYFEQEQARRGGTTIFDPELMADEYYAQTFLPPREQRSAEGHAVRAAYLYCAMADLAAETGDERLKTACRAIFRDIERGKLYITGGVGSAEYGERFTAAFDLPNDACYCESCASIGLALFALRMLRMERDGRYADVMERALYNNVLAGISRDGNRFFYVNPLEVTPEFCDHSMRLRHVKTERQQWFDVACCPTNIARTLGSLGQYAFGQAEGELFVHLYLPSEASFPGGSLRLDTRYPADGQIDLHLTLDRPLSLSLRVPGHSPLRTLTLDGAPQSPRIEKGYARLDCPEGTHEIALALDVRPRYLYADPRVSADCGDVALTLGPLVYCFEQADNGPGLAAAVVDPSKSARPRPCPVDGAAPALTVSGWREKAPEGEDALYREAAPVYEPAEFTAIPYSLWNHRGRGEMRVWMRHCLPRLEG